MVICISFAKIEFEAETIFKLLMWQKMIEVAPSAIICHQLLAASCREYYFSLYSTPDTLFPWKTCVALKDPSQGCFLLVDCRLRKILTLDILWNKGVTVVDWCYMDKRSGESVNHLLLHCPIASESWTLVWAVFGLLRVMPQSVTDLFSALQGPFW